MFIVVKDSPGNAPLVRVYSDHGEAEKDFNKTHLDKYVPNVHLAQYSPEHEGTTVVKSRFYADGEETLWHNPLA